MRCVFVCSGFQNEQILLYEIQQESSACPAYSGLQRTTLNGNVPHGGNHVRLSSTKTSHLQSSDPISERNEYEEYDDHSMFMGW